MSTLKGRRARDCVRHRSSRGHLGDHRAALEQLHSLLPAADIELTVDVLDRIDEIVAPGVTLNPADTSDGEQVLRPSRRRR